MYLDYAEDQARRRRPVSMAEWADKLDAFLSFNERDVLTHAGRLRMDVAQKLAVERFEVFNANRRAAEALAADEADIAQLEELEKAAKGREEGARRCLSQPPQSVGRKQRWTMWQRFKLASQRASQ